jgi:outer membrane protein assembly factor BamB
MIRHQATIPFFGFLLLASCSGTQLHPELRQGFGGDNRVMLRQWARDTKTEIGRAGIRGIEYSSPAPYENTMIFGSVSRGLVAIYPGINQVRWEFPIRGGATSPVSVYKDFVFAGGGDGVFYCLEADSGKLRWKYDMRNTQLSRATVNSGRVFVTASDDTIYAFDLNSGEWIWHYRRRSSIAATLHGASQPLVDSGEVIAGMADGYLVGLSANDGKLVWEKKLQDGVKFIDVDAHPVLDGNVLYIAAYDGALHALDRRTRQVLWKFDAGGGKDITVEGDRIFLPSSDGNVYALQRSNGRQIWKFEADGGAPTRVIPTPRGLVFGSSYQYLYLLDREGKAHFRYDVGHGSGFSADPIFDEKSRRLTLLSDNGVLYSFLVRDESSLIHVEAATDPYDFDWQQPRRRKRK